MNASYKTTPIVQHGRAHRFSLKRRVTVGMAWLCLISLSPFLSHAQVGQIQQPLYLQSDAIWPNSKIPVCWEMDTEEFSESWAERRLVRNIVETQYETISEVNFVAWGRCRSNIQGIRIEVKDKRAKVKKFGRKLDGINNGMRLNFQYTKWVTACSSTIATKNRCIQWDALHEFGHALGFSHAQNRPDTEKSTCTEDSQGEDGDLFLGQNDSDSVMNYCSLNYQSKFGTAELSPGDIAGVTTVYGTPGGLSQIIEGSSSGGIPVRAYSNSMVHLLSGFHLAFRNGDHHLRKIGIEPTSGELFASIDKFGVVKRKNSGPGVKFAFYDTEINDPYDYKAIFQNINPTGVTISSASKKSCKGSCTIKVSSPRGAVFVLRGFRFRYREKDRHIDQIGILEQDGDIRVFFNDKNNDDPFDVTIHYAYLPESLFVKSNLQAQGLDGKGVDSEFAEDGRRVLRGFFFDFNNKDHEIEKVGVNYSGPSSSRLFVEFADEKDNDEYTWQVFYARLF